VSHPLHPAVVHFPIATWSLATVADIAGLWWHGPAFLFAAWLLLVGTAMALVAAATGMVQFLQLPANDVRGDLVMRHMSLVLVAFACYATSLLLRVHGVDWRGGVAQAPAPWAIAAGVVGFVFLLLGGYRGGQLVYRHRIGVGRS